MMSRLCWQRKEVSHTTSLLKGRDIPLPLPPEFQANPRFTFQPTTQVEDAPNFAQRNPEEESVPMCEDNSDFQTLLDAFTQSQSQGTPSRSKEHFVCVHDRVRDINGSPSAEPVRHSRQRNRPLLYQSEVEEEREKHIKEVQQQTKVQALRDPPPLQHE